MRSIQSTNALFVTIYPKSESQFLATFSQIILTFLAIIVTLVAPSQKH